MQTENSRPLTSSLSTQLFGYISRFVAMAGIGGIAQTVAADLIAPLANSNLSDEEFEQLKGQAMARGYVIEVA